MTIDDYYEENNILDDCHSLVSMLLEFDGLPPEIERQAKGLLPQLEAALDWVTLH